MHIFKRISDIEYVRAAIDEKADLSAFKEKPSLRILVGIATILFSYVVGWPAIGALGTLAVYLDKPLLAVVGGPLMYGLSHLVFILGMYLAGAKYARIFFRWATRVMAEKFIEPRA